MSAVSRRLAQRTLPSPASSQVEGSGTLADLEPGATARISGHSAGLAPSTSRRLLDLGFTPGATIEVVRRAPAHDPIIYRVAECEIGIRRVLARAVLVERA